MTGAVRTDVESMHLFRTHFLQRAFELLAVARTFPERLAIGFRNEHINSIGCCFCLSPAQMMICVCKHDERSI
jgi:hypothetical protein